nr:immunoglobulin domain-containing protein WRK-1C [Caenorhabditis elegans]
MKLVLLILGLLIASTSAQIRTKGGTLIAKEGESLTLRCEVEDPSVAIIWRKNTEVVAVDDEILDTYGGYEISMEGSTSVLTIKRVEPINSANYSCALAEPEVSVTFVIKVQVKPLVVISPDTGVYHARVGEKNLVITCHVKEGNPKPGVVWTKQAAKLPEDIKREHGGARIVITEVKKHHAGKYNCLAENIAGSDRATIDIHVAEPLQGEREGRPGPPQLSFDESELTWTVRAFDKILEYQLCHRLENADHFLPEDCNSVRVKKSDNNGDDKWTHTIDLSTFLEHGNKYHVQLKARNALGWGSMAKDALHVELQRIEKEEAKGASIISIISSILVTLVTMYLLF